MTDREKERNEALRRNAVEKMWLNYYNNELLARGLISESMHRKMKLEISMRKPGDKSWQQDDLEIR
jgi:hypothetical protein